MYFPNLTFLGVEASRASKFSVTPIAPSSRYDSSGVIRRECRGAANRDGRITSDRDVWRKALAFRANAAHYWNLNRYSTGRNQLLGSIVSIQMWSIVQGGYPF